MEEDTVMISRRHLDKFMKRKGLEDQIQELGASPVCQFGQGEPKGLLLCCILQKLFPQTLLVAESLDFIAAEGQKNNAVLIM